MRLISTSYVTDRAPRIVDTRISEIKGLSSLSEPRLWAAGLLGWLILS